MSGNKSQMAGSTLSNSDDRFRKIFDSIIDVYYRTDSTGTITMVSPSVYPLTGYKPEEIIGTDISSYYLEPSRLQGFREKIIDEGRVYQKEEEIVAKDGSVVFVSANVNKLVDQKGNFIGVEGIFRDITEKKKAEKALMESEERYRMLSNLTFEGIIFHDDGYILDCNQSFLNMMGYKRDEIIGKNIIELAIPDRWKSRVIDNMRSGYQKPYQVEGVNRKGEVIPVEVESREVRYKNREVRATAIRDLRESFKARAELQAANIMLEAILNTIPVRVFWKDKNLKYLGCNALVAKDANLHSTADIVGKDDYELPWHKYAQHYRKDDAGVIASNKQKLNYEENIIDPDGNSMHIKTSKIPLKDHSGEVIGILGCWEDITDQKVHEQEIEENSRRLERANQELDNFVYRVSHDLKSPISSVKGLVNIARLENDPKRIRECLDLIEQSMNKLDEFIIEILDYSRNARFELTIEPIDLEKLILEIFDQHKYGESHQIAEIHVRIQKDRKVHSDKRRLSYIFNNLISNSLKFSDPEKGRPFIGVDVKFTKKYVVIEYRDNGVGIERDHIEFIFDMFYRAKEGKPGSGLGLYIVAEAVNKLKGEITVQSRPGEGTWFTIKIPNEAG